MPTIYKAVELTNDQREVLSAIAAITACDALPTRPNIAQFANIPSKRLTTAVASLKSLGLVKQSTVKDTPLDPVETTSPDLVIDDATKEAKTESDETPDIVTGKL